jgi:hypothetical protein
MGCSDIRDGSAELPACPVSFIRPLFESLGSSLTDPAHEELCLVPTRRSSMSMNTNIMAGLRLHSVCRKLMNG